MELTTAETAARLGIKPVTVRLYCKTGAIQARKAGRDWLIAEEEVERYARERRPPHRPAKPKE